MIIIFVSIVTLFFLYFCVYKPHQYWKKLNVPYIKPFPIFGVMHKIIFACDSISEGSQKIYESHQSQVVGFYFFNMPVLMIKDLDLIKQIGIKDFDHFIDHKSNFSEDDDPLFCKGLFLLRGEKWRQMRSTLSPAFTSSKMRSMFVLMAECAKKYTNYFVETIDPNKPLEIELLDTFNRFATDIIATTAFGVECNSIENKNNEFYLMGKDATNFNTRVFLKFFGFQYLRPLMKLFNIQFFSQKVSTFFRTLVKNNIDMREKKNLVRIDLFHLLMEAKKGKLKHELTKDKDIGFATVQESNIGRNTPKIEFTENDIIAQSLLFFNAGFDTISTAMSHMAYELAQNEDIQNRLQSEIDQAMEESKGKVTYEMVLKLKYLDMVFCETLRKWPPFATMDRECTEDYILKLNDLNIPEIPIRKHDVIWYPIYAIHRDPKYYPNPEKFDPERFSDENKKNIVPMSFIPFGVGPRNCIGSRFAILEAKTVFIFLLSKFNFILTEKSQVPIQITKTKINLHAVNGFWVALKLRNK